MVWDEGNAIWRAEGIAAWWQQVLSTPPWRWGELFAQETIRHYWRYTVTLEGHPAFYGIVIALGRTFAPAGLPPWQQARFGPIALFAMAAGIVYWYIRAHMGRIAGLASVAGILLLPHVFAHLHFATPDSPLCSLWIISAIVYCACLSQAGTSFCPTTRPKVPAYRRALRLHAGILARSTPVGIVLGLTMATKFTGWLAPVPLMVWTLVRRRGLELVGFVYALAVAICIFAAVNPPIWHDPVGGIAEFIRRNLDRSAYNVSILFLGRRYDLYHPLPWYNTLVWMAVTVPTFLLLCLAVGVAAALRHGRKAPWLGLLLVEMLWLLAVRATPWAPPHDGVRLFLPSVAFAGLVAGLGASTLLNLACQLWTKDHRKFPRRLARMLAALVAIGVAIGTVRCVHNLWCYASHWLSFYNGLIGGPAGAQQRGLEVTYYWDALTPEVIAWLEHHTQPGDKVYFAAGPSENLLLLQRWGYISFEFRSKAPGVWRWYVLQHRFGVWQAEDWWLVENRTPVFAKTLFAGKKGCGASDVVLLSIYRWEDYVDARSSVGRHTTEMPADHQQER